jgi:HK97 gp10 family phage protein
MVQFVFNLRGVPEIEEFLNKKFPRRLQQVLLQNALEAGAVPIIKQAFINLIADVRVTGIKTDPLAAGLNIGRVRRRRRRGVVSVGVRTPTRAQLGIGKNAKWYYPAHIELGTKKAPARPYMRPALEQQRDNANTIITEALKRGIEALALEHAPRSR